MSVRITRVDTNSRRAVDRFIDLQFRLYRDCPQWVPPLLSDIKLQLNRRAYPYYEHSEAEFLLAECDGRVAGRIAVLDNRHYNEYWQAHTAFFNLFDVENDQDVAMALFDAAAEWATGRGLNKMVGTKGFLQGDGIGVLVDGFEHHPAIGIPYNYEYYGKLIEGAGFVRQRDFYSAYLPGNHHVPDRLFEIADKVKERRGFSIKRFKNKAELKAMIPEIVKTYNDTFTGNWEFNPVTANEARVIGERLMQIADPRYIKLVMKGDVIAGFLFGFQDISEGLQRSRGRLFPLGWLWILRSFRNTSWINLNGAGILAAYRGLGINALMYTEMEKTIREGSFAHADLVQMEESVLTLKDTETMGGRVYKTHRIYEKDLLVPRAPGPVTL